MRRAPGNDTLVPGRMLAPALTAWGRQAVAVTTSPAACILVRSRKAARLLDLRFPAGGDGLGVIRAIAWSNDAPRTL